VRYILGLLGPALVVVAVGAPDILGLWIGPDYARQGALALRVLAAGVAVNALAHVPYALLQGRGRPDLPAKFQLVELPLHLGLTWLLVRAYGVPGAAIAWSARMALDAALLFGAAHRLGAISPGVLRQARLTRTALWLAGVAALAGVAGAGAVAQTRLGVMVAATMASTVVVWRLSLDAADRARVLRALRATAA
jgi:O-antigen/teichoic acid export membrane protein